MPGNIAPPQAIMTLPLCGRGCTLILLLAAVLGHTPTAHADRVSKLNAIYARNPDYKVKLQILQVLGGLDSPRGVPTLTRALSDKDIAVRITAARALAKIHDVTALEALGGALQKEKDSSAKDQLKDTIRALEKLKAGLPQGTHFYVKLGKITNTSDKGTPDLVELLGETLLKELRRCKGVATCWGGESPAPKKLQERKIEGFILSSKILRMNHKPDGKMVTISGEVRTTLTPMGDGERRYINTARNGVSVPTQIFKTDHLETYYIDLVEAMARVMKANMCRKFLKVTDESAHAR